MDKESIAIIGGGIAGISSALEIAKTGKFNVTIFDKNSFLGGLSSYYKWNNLICDRFYHVILPTDSYLREFIKDLEIEALLFWNKARSGFFGEEKLVPLNSIFDFFRFPFLSPSQKLRLGAGIIYVTQLKDASSLNNILAKQWLIKIFGLGIYNKIWEPLLRSKLGSASEKIPAVFMWTVINRLYGARTSASKKEKMGYVKGGYYSIINAARKRLDELHVEISLKTKVEKVEVDPKNKQICLTHSSGFVKFERLLFTVPCPEVLRLTNENNSDPYWTRLRKIEYLGIICVLLVLRRRLSHYYVINLLDKKLPFTGIIESTNVLYHEDFANKHLVYLPKYITSHSDLSTFDDKEVYNLFVDKLRVIFPDLKNKDILHHKIFRDSNVQPIQNMNLLQSKFEVRTPFPNVYLINSSMIYNSTLNNNTTIRLAKKAVKTIVSE